MEPSRGEHSDSDISDDWNVIETKESVAVSESESIEVIDDVTDDVIGDVIATPATTDNDPAGQSDLDSCSSARLVTDYETNEANESDSSSQSLLARSRSSRQLIINEESLQLQTQLSSPQLVGQTSAMLFISNQMFAFLMLLIAVALSYNGEGALSRLANLDFNSKNRDDLTSKDYQSHSEMRDCSNRLIQAEKKIENIRLAAQSLEDGTMSIPVFMDFLKDIGRPSYGQLKTNWPADEAVDFNRKRKLERHVGFSDQSASRLEKSGDASVRHSQRSKDSIKLKHEGVGYPSRFESKVIKDAPRFEDQVMKDFKNFVQDSDLPDRSQSMIHQISSILKTSERSDFQRLGVTLLNVSLHLAKSSEKIKNISLTRESSHSKTLALLEKLSIVSSKIDQQLFDFFHQLALKLSKNLDKIEEQFIKIYCKTDSEFNYCKNKSGKSGVKETRKSDRSAERKFEKNRSKKSYMSEKYEIDGDTVGKADVSDRDRNHDGTSKYLQKKNDKFAKNTKREESADEFRNSDGKNFEKGEKRFKDKDARKMKKSKYARSVENSQNVVELTENQRGNDFNRSDSSVESHKRNKKSSINDELRLKKNFVEMSFETIDKSSDRSTHQESKSDFYNSDSVILGNVEHNEQGHSGNFDSLTAGDGSVPEMFLKHEIPNNKPLQVENFETKDDFSKTDEGDLSGSDSKAGNFENDEGFDKFTRKDLAKLKRQLLETANQNVEQLFDRFVASLEVGGAQLNSTSQSEDWFLLLGDSRSKMRQINSQSDWLFDRAVNRRANRHGGSEEASMWLFRRALEREKCRHVPHSQNCLRSSSFKNFKFNRKPLFESKKHSPDR